MDLHHSILTLREAYGQARLNLVRNGHPLTLLENLDSLQAGMEGLAPEVLALRPTQMLLATAFRPMRAAPTESGKYAVAVMVFFLGMGIPWVEEAGLHGALYDAS